MIPTDIDINFLIRWELGGAIKLGQKFHHPGNTNSGPTISVGIDLGYLNVSRFETIFKDVATKAIRDRMKTGLGLKGNTAKIWVANNKDIILTEDDVKITFSRILDEFWKMTLKRYTGIENAPGAVKTACLSVGYNRGVFNNDPRMVAFDTAIEKCDYKSAADIVDSMQEGSYWEKKLSSVYRGLNLRRDAEAALIRSVLKKG